MNRYQIYKLPRTTGDLPTHQYEAAAPMAHQPEWGQLAHQVQALDSLGAPMRDPVTGFAVMVDVAQNYEVVATNIDAEIAAAAADKTQRRTRLDRIKALRDLIRAGTSTAADRNEALEKLLTQYLKDLREE